MRRLVRALVVGASLGLGVLAVQCAEVRRGLGDSCIRDSDCLSGFCAGQQCVAAPPLVDASSPVEASSDAGSDANAAPLDGSVDASPAVDAAPDTGSDAPQPDASPDAPSGDASPPDAAVDAASDASVTDSAVDTSAPADSATDASVDGPASDA